MKGQHKSCINAGTHTDSTPRPDRKPRASRKNTQETANKNKGEKIMATTTKTTKSISDAALDETLEETKKAVTDPTERNEDEKINPKDNSYEKAVKDSKYLHRLQSIVLENNKHQNNALAKVKDLVEDVCDRIHCTDRDVVDLVIEEVWAAVQRGAFNGRGINGYIESIVKFCKIKVQRFRNHQDHEVDYDAWRIIKKKEEEYAEKGIEADKVPPEVKYAALVEAGIGKERAEYYSKVVSNYFKPRYFYDNEGELSESVMSDSVFVSHEGDPERMTGNSDTCNVFDIDTLAKHPEKNDLIHKYAIEGREGKEALYLGVFLIKTAHDAKPDTKNSDRAFCSDCTESVVSFINRVAKLFDDDSIQRELKGKKSDKSRVSYIYGRVKETYAKGSEAFENFKEFLLDMIPEIETLLRRS